MTGLRSSQECLWTGKIHCKYIFPLSFSWLYLDYNHANENCLPHISSTCWRDDVGVTKPHSSNRAIWSIWFAFFGWLLTPVWGLWLLSWETPGSWCRVFQREEKEGNLGCTATLCCRKRFPASGAAVENDDWAPPHCCKPPLYCGWGKLNAVSQAFNYAVRPLPLNNILYFLPSHCILPDIFVLYLANIHLTSSLSAEIKWAAVGFWPLTRPPVLFHCNTPVQPLSTPILFNILL